MPQLDSRKNPPPGRLPTFRAHSRATHSEFMAFVGGGGAVAVSAAPAASAAAEAAPKEEEKKVREDTLHYREK